MCDLARIVISEAHQNPTSAFEKRGLGIQFMASPWLGLIRNSGKTRYQKQGFWARILNKRGGWSKWALASHQRVLGGGSHGDYLESFNDLAAVEGPSISRWMIFLHSCCKDSFPKWKLFHLVERFKDLISLDVSRWSSVYISFGPCRFPRQQPNNRNETETLQGFSHNWKFTNRILKSQSLREYQEPRRQNLGGDLREKQ